MPLKEKNICFFTEPKVTYYTTDQPDWPATLTSHTNQLDSLDSLAEQWKQDLLTDHTDWTVTDTSDQPNY